MKTKLASILLLLLSFQLSFAQQESNVVIKEVLFVRHFIGDFKLPKPADTILSLTRELDSYRFLIVPYNKRPGGGHWAFENYLFEFWRNPFIYNYNEVFLSNMTFKQDYVDMIKASSKKSKYTDLVSSLPNDQTYLKRTANARDFCPNFNLHLCKGGIRLCASWICMRIRAPEILNVV